MVSCGHDGTGCCGVWPAGQLEAEVDEGLTRSPLESRPPNAGWSLWWVSLPLTFLVCVSFYSDKLRLCTAVMKWHLVLVIHGTRTTGQPRLSAIVQARRLSLFGHIARMPDETDARTIYNCFPFGGLEETTRTSSNYVDEDYPARPEIKQSLTGWGDNCGSESSALETDVCVWR